MKKTITRILAFVAALVCGGAWAATPLVYNQYLTSEYADTGWTVASADDLASRRFAGIMADANVNSGNPLPSMGYYVTKQSDDTVTFEMQVKNNQLKAILVRMQIVDGTVRIKGERAGYRAAENPIGTRCFTEDGNALAENTSPANFGTSENASDSYACGAVNEVLSWSNASYVGQPGYRVGGGAYGPYRLRIPATADLPLGSILRIKEISIARRDGSTDQKSVISVGPANDANVASDGNSVDTTDRLGGKTRIRYPFSKNVMVLVGTEYPSYLLNEADGGSTINTMQIHVITPIDEGADVLKQTNNDLGYCAIYEVKAEVVSLFAPDTSRDEDVSFVTPNAPTQALKATVETDNTAFGTNLDYTRLVNGRWAQVVNVTNSTAAATAKIFGGTAQNAEGAVNADIWMNVSGGTYGAIFGGSNCDKWENARQSTIKGNVVLEVGGSTMANNVLGGFYKDGFGPTLNGNIDVVIKDQAVVKGVIAGAGMSAHNNNAAYTGDVKVTVKNVQSDNSAEALSNADSSDYIVGGGVYGTNANSKENITGNTAVVIDLPSDATGSFVKNIVGGGFIPTGGASRGTPECKVSGNTSVSISAPAGVTFSGDIYAGGYLVGTSSGNVSVGGTASVTLNGGMYTGFIKAGTATGAKTLAVNGDITVKPNNTAIEGFDSLTIADTKTLTLVAEDAKAMSLSVPGTGSIAKTGAGVLTLNNLPAGANYAVAITDGGLTLDGDANGLTIDMNSENGTLTIGTSRPTVNVRAGSVTLTATDAEIASGAIVVTVSSDAAEVSVEQVTVLDSTGHELNVASVAKTSDTQLTITLQKFEPITGEKLISELHLSDDAAGTLEIRGGATEDAAFTVTFDAALPAGVTVSVSGYVKFVTGGDITSVPLSSFGYADGTVVEIVADPGAIEIPAGLTLCIDANAATTTAPLTVAGKLTGSGAVAIKNGAVKFTNNENGYTGGLTVKSGAIAMTSQQNGFGATGSDPGITVENGGAVDLANTKDNLGYHYVIAGTGVNDSGALYSTQEMGTTSRQTSQIKLSEDATIVCNNKWGLLGNGYGATVLNLAGHTLTKQGSADFILINAGMGGATSGSINVAAGGIHTANNSYTDALGNYNLTMAEGTTLNLESNMTINSLVGQGEGVKVIGNRTLTANLYTGKVVVESGSPTMTGVAQCACASFVVKSGATMNVGCTDFFSYNQNGYGTVDVYGTLNFGVNRETLREAWTFNFYSGCTVNGFGDNNSNWPCAMEIWNANHTINFLMSDADQTGVVNFNTTLGLENNATFDVAEGVTVVCNGATSGQNTRDFINRYGNGKVVTKTGEGTLRINTACTATIKLTAGTIKSPNELTVEKTDANKKIVTSTETEDETTIHVWSLAQRDPTTVYATQGFNSYKLDANTVVTLVDGDTIVCNRGYMGGNNWGGGKDLSSLANKGHKIIIEHEMDLGGNVGIPAAMQVEVKYRDYSNIEDRKGVYLYGSIGENAQISGTGALFLGFGGDCTIADGVTISCDTGFQSAGKTAIINGTVTMSGKVYLNGSVIKLGTAQAKLIVNEAIAANGVQSGVENKFVKYDVETTTYSLCDLIELNAKKTGLVVDAVGAVINTVEVDDTETVFSETTIPLGTTAHYRIRAGSVTKDVGVIVAKEAEEAGSEPVTTAVAVPFASLAGGDVTVDSLLNKALLNPGDQLMAWIGETYNAWQLNSDKTEWKGVTVVKGTGDNKVTIAEAGGSDTTVLPRGSAVWVKSAGKVVVYGMLPASDDSKVTVDTGVYLLGNTKMKAAKPEDQVVLAVGDIVEIPGDTEGVRQYEKTADGWKGTKQVPNGTIQIGNDEITLWETVPTTAAPSVPEGRGYFLKRP